MTREKMAFIRWWHGPSPNMRISINPIWYVQTPQVRFNDKPTKLTPIYWRNKYKDEYRFYNKPAVNS
jgi:hypothetical protein